MKRAFLLLPCLLIAAAAETALCAADKPQDADETDKERWTLGAPVVSYWATPMTEAAARQLKEGGWNLVWCREGELDLVAVQGLRAQLNDSRLTPAALDDPDKPQALDALIERVRKHPALYSYFLADEPGANDFAALGRLVAHLREKDPAYLAYINLLPTYAPPRGSAPKATKSRPKRSTCAGSSRPSGRRC